MIVKMKGAGEQSLPDALARSLIDKGLAAEVVITSAEKPRPSLKMKREELASIAEGLGHSVETADNKADLLAKIESGPAKPSDD